MIDAAVAGLREGGEWPRCFRSVVVADFARGFRTLGG